MNLTFDLVTEPWIPVLRDEGGFAELGLRDVLIESPRLREIAHDSPLFVAAIYPLLAAIMHRVLPGETDRERETEWLRIWRQGKFNDADVKAIDDYFARWSDRFDLFHPRFPFYQVAGLEMNKADPLSRLAMEEQLNDSSPFANDANPDWFAPSPALAARLLVTIQSYVHSLGKSSRAKIAGKEIEPPYFAGSPLLRGLTVWASGDTLFQTLMLYLVPHELAVEDAPCWELDAPHELRDRSVNGKRQTTAPGGICDLLTLQSRLIRLLPEERDGAVIVPRAFFTQGRSLEKDTSGRPVFHPLKLYTISKKEGFAVLRLYENRAIWRNAHTLLSPKACGYDRNVLHWVRRLKSDGDVFDDKFQPNLNVVGLATDPIKSDKYLLWRHDRLPLPPVLLTNSNLVGLIESANEDAENVAKEMRRRFASVAYTFVTGKPKPKGRSKSAPGEEALVNKFDPCRTFWSCLEDHFYRLLERLPEQPEVALKEWEDDVQRAAQECLRAACNALGTSPRAVTAVAQIDAGQPYNLSYLRDPRSYLAAKRERERKAKTSRKRSDRVDMASSPPTADAP